MSAVSTQNLGAMPSISELRRLLKSLALLDLIMEPEWQYRYYSYDSSWGEGEEMGSMRNGQGDEFYVLFQACGCFIKGFDHESAMSPWNFKDNLMWPGVLASVPAELESAVEEPAFSMENTTFCIWRLASDSEWKCGDIKFPENEDPDGSAYLLELLDRNPQRYLKFCKEYFEKEIPIEAIESIYKHLPITEDIVASLNNDLKISDISAEMIQIGYPEPIEG